MCLKFVALKMARTSINARDGACEELYQQLTGSPIGGLPCRKYIFLKLIHKPAQSRLFSTEIIYPFTDPILLLMNFKTTSKIRKQVMKLMKKSLRNLDTYDRYLIRYDRCVLHNEIMMLFCIKVPYQWPWRFSF